tara:strand:+ start:1111 stop:1563 length:453 start_codon:yes stop_codon:yes gene_type:complete
MINSTLRVYMPDFIYTEQEDDVISKLTEVGNIANNLKVYLWYEESNKINPKDFIQKWDRLPHNNFRTIIRPTFFDLQRDFIWYDIIPRRIYDTKSIQYSRFSWIYGGGPDGVLAGLDEFRRTYEFVTADKEKPVKKKQKRNDGEDSDYRE